MEFGRLVYEPQGSWPLGGPVRAALTLTLIGQGDEAVLRREGLVALRRRRIVRLTQEALRQGALLGYADLAEILFTSVATLKRDVREIEGGGMYVPLRGRRGSRNGAWAAVAGEARKANAR